MAISKIWPSSRYQLLDRIPYVQILSETLVLSGNSAILEVVINYAYYIRFSRHCPADGTEHIAIHISKWPVRIEELKQSSEPLCKGDRIPSHQNAPNIMSIEEKGGIQLMEQAHLRAETWSIS